MSITARALRDRVNRKLAETCEFVVKINGEEGSCSPCDHLCVNFITDEHTLVVLEDLGRQLGIL